MNPTRLVPERMSPSMTLGLFRPLMQNGSAGLFYIVEREGGGRTAIALDGGDPNYLFEVWEVTDGMESWEGLSLGKVEPLVDLESGEFYASTRPARGALWIGQGSVTLGVKPYRGVGTIAIRIGDAATSEPATGAQFSRWRLVQYDHAGKPVVLYERQNAAS